jgi:hypothetical protein
MDLELKKDTLEYYEFRARTSELHEETMETIVPDYCPDISRVLCADGTVTEESCGLTGSKASISGTAQVCVLYLPDGDGGVRALSVSLPFSVVAENAEWEGCERLMADVSIVSAEARCLNPRKIFTRVQICAEIRGVAAVTAEICCDTADGARVEKKMCTDAMSYISSVTEKEFTYVDEIGVSSGKEPIAELLTWSARAIVQEARRTGAKIVVKGLLHADFLYRSDSGTLCTVSEEMRLSQIMEAEGGSEDAMCFARLFVCGTEMHTGGESDPSSRRVITAKFRMKARAVLRDTRNITYLSDAYSTSCAMTAETSQLRYTRLSEQAVRRQAVHEIIEAGTTVKTVLYCKASCGDTAVERDGGNLNLRTQLTVHVIFIDENDTPSSIERRIDAACQMEEPEGLACAAAAECADEVYASAVSDGIEVRVSVDFTITAEDQRSELCITAMSLDTDSPADMSKLPSVVMRRPDRGETLWDVAKRSRTTVGEICAANGITDSSAPLGGGLLLIPRKR